MLGALGFSALLVLASLTAGKAYWWCIPMQQAMVEPCCEHELDDGHEGGGAQDATESPSLEGQCCVGKSVAELPATAAPGAPERVALGPALLVSLPPLTMLPEPSPAPRAAPVRAAPRRWSPTRDGPRFASERCVELQVFRC